MKMSPHHDHDLGLQHDLERIAASYKRSGTPIYVIGVGQANMQDLAVSQVRCRRTVSKDTMVRVEVDVRKQGVPDLDPTVYISRNGRQVGYLTSGGYGYTVGKPIGYGYVRDGAGVDDAYVLEGDYELVVAKDVVKAQVHLEPLYDPVNARVKG